MRIVNTFIFFFLLSNYCVSQSKTEAYINQYQHLAISEMNTYGVPASITLAQGILESGNGESRLAVEGNNHFGIKCHSDWAGSTIIQDDDEKGECFRKYKNVKDSYRDHSLFLTQRDRYSFLFINNDYKKWAKGLSKAGYATNPKYATLLIDLIEKYSLDRFDMNQNIRQRLYFANILGVPYLTGLGGYYFDNKLMIFSDIQTSILISRINVGMNYDLFNGFYFGLNSGVNFFERNNEYVFYAKVGVELAYTKVSSNYSKKKIFKLGVDYSRVDESSLSYCIIPYINVIYLIK